MDVEKLIEACQSHQNRDCTKCPYSGSVECQCLLNVSEILAVKSHYEALLSQERSMVIAEVGENMKALGADSTYGYVARWAKLRNLLDLMDKGVTK